MNTRILLRKSYILEIRTIITESFFEFVLGRYEKAVYIYFAVFEINKKCYEDGLYNRARYLQLMQYLYFRLLEMIEKYSWTGVNIWKKIWIRLEENHVWEK